ncbi:hypothetical protein HMPREF9952_1122 [Haemophilus pittmaniae HK 85]|uniref:Uncharacterized protein n=1 Tax=Haemophilus pittmaniae HK 85 TaxID=1035188 RepID=F9QCB4_9PAST|nr:hypothetical protein HMPREF9952_1122 [Haemophilus pittmaniae HK 85]
MILLHMIKNNLFSALLRIKNAPCLGAFYVFILLLIKSMG